MAKTVTTTIQYIKWLDLFNKEKPFVLLCDIPKEKEDQRQSNIIFEDISKKVQDLRGSTDQLSLDENGFIFRNHQTSVELFTDQKNVDENYLPEMEALIRKEVDGVDQVFFFDWRVRDAREMETKVAENFESVESHDLEREEEQVFDLNDFTLLLCPVTYCHIDQSPFAVLSRIKLQLGKDADWLLVGRVRIINVWRPIRNPVEDWPLAICDGSTARASDFVEADYVRHGYIGATLYGMNNEEHRWYYLDQQRPDEALIMKMFDSDPTVKAKSCPHSSFKVPDAPPKAPKRKSIEVRALVFTYPED